MSSALSVRDAGVLGAENIELLGPDGDYDKRTYRQTDAEFVLDSIKTGAGESFHSGQYFKHFFSPDVPTTTTKGLVHINREIIKDASAVSNAWIYCAIRATPFVSRVIACLSLPQLLLSSCAGKVHVIKLRALCC